MVEIIKYNSVVILSFFFISLLALILKYVTHNYSNTLLFSSYRSSIFNPLTYIRLFTHILGHSSWSHFMNNFLYILLIGPMVEEKYGSRNLLIMIGITSFITGMLNSIFTKKRILGASGIVFMLIILSSFVNVKEGIPLTLILICLFYVADEIIKMIIRKDNVSHMGHLIGAICGFIFGFLIFK